MKRTITILMIAALCAVFVSAIDIYYTQEQLDALEVDGFTWQTLLCDSNGLVYVDGANLATDYNCTDIEKVGELYHFYTGEFTSYYPLDIILVCLRIPDVCGEYPEYCTYNESIPYSFNCQNCTTVEFCEKFYFNRVVDNALLEVERIKLDIKMYQTQWGNETGQGWNGTIFE